MWEESGGAGLQSVTNATIGKASEDAVHYEHYQDSDYAHFDDDGEVEKEVK